MEGNPFRSNKWLPELVGSGCSCFLDVNWGCPWLIESRGLLVLDQRQGCCNRPIYHRPRGVTVSTLDSESSDRGSNPREAYCAAAALSCDQLLDLLRKGRKQLLACSRHVGIGSRWRASKSIWQWLQQREAFSLRFPSKSRSLENLTLLDLRVSSSPKGSANPLCVVPISTDDFRRGPEHASSFQCVDVANSNEAIHLINLTKRMSRMPR